MLLFAEIEECKLKTEIYPNRGLCVNVQKGVFFSGLFRLLVFLLFFVIFGSFWTRPQKGLFSCSFRGCSSFVPRKALLFFPFFFFFFFSFSLSKFLLFSSLFAHQPVFGKLVFVWFVLSLFLRLSFLNACFCLSNKLSQHAPFQTQFALMFGCFFLLLFLFLFLFMFYVSVSVFKLVLLWYVFHLFHVFFLVVLSDYEKSLFSLQF